jgi:hypothetical protein
VGWEEPGAGGAADAMELRTDRNDIRNRDAAILVRSIDDNQLVFILLLDVLT